MSYHASEAWTYVKIFRARLEKDFTAHKSIFYKIIKFINLLRDYSCMGTNYYAVTKWCQHCNRGDKLHLGKSSQGWKFLIRLWPEAYKDFSSFTTWLKTNVQFVEDDYGEQESVDSFLKFVETKQAEKLSMGEEVDGYRFQEREFS